VLSNIEKLLKVLYEKKKNWPKSLVEKGLWKKVTTGVWFLTKIQLNIEKSKQRKRRSQKKLDIKNLPKV
jgi:hypothetical protein